MNNHVKIALISSAAFILGILINTHAVSNASIGNNIAVVDMAQVLNSSPKAQSLKIEQKRKFEELTTFVGKAREDIVKETDPNKMKELEQKYQNEFESKRALIEKDFETKVTQINNDITKQIENIVKEKNYDLVLSKNSVLSGGNDITNEVSQKIK